MIIATPTNTTIILVLKKTGPLWFIELRGIFQKGCLLCNVAKGMWNVNKTFWHKQVETSLIDPSAFKKMGSGPADALSQNLLVTKH